MYPCGGGFAVGHRCPELRDNPGIDFNDCDLNRDVRSVRQHALNQGRRERPDTGPGVEHAQDSRLRQGGHAGYESGSALGGEELPEPDLRTGVEFSKRRNPARLGPR